MSESINHPAHYGGDSQLEAIKVIEYHNLGFCLGNVVKYVLRSDKKGNQIEDLKKAKWYLEREIAKLEPKLDIKVDTSEFEASLEALESIAGQMQPTNEIGYDKMLNWDQAYKAIKEGKRIRHVTWGVGEYVAYTENGIFDEKKRVWPYGFKSLSPHFYIVKP